MASRSLQLVPAGARSIAPGVYQLPSRRRHGGGGALAHRHRRGKGMRRSSKHSLFSKQWVWYAVALALADAIGTVVLTEVGPWVSVPAVVLYAYGVWKNKPGAKNAALAIQGAHLLAYWGITKTISDLASKNFGGGGS